MKLVIETGLFTRLIDVEYKVSQSPKSKILYNEESCKEVTGPKGKAPVHWRLSTDLLDFFYKTHWRGTKSSEVKLYLVLS